MFAGSVQLVLSELCRRKQLHAVAENEDDECGDGEVVGSKSISGRKDN